VDWILFAETNAPGVFTDPVMVGFATTAHDNATSTSAQYRNFHFADTVLQPSTQSGSETKTGNNFTARIATQSEVAYVVEYKIH